MQQLRDSIKYRKVSRAFYGYGIWSFIKSDKFFREQNGT